MRLAQLHGVLPDHEAGTAVEIVATLRERLQRGDKVVTEFAQICKHLYAIPPSPPVELSLPRIRLRNVIYHVYPSKNNDIWRRNVRALLHPDRVKLLNGRRVVAIAVASPDLESPRTVEKLFRPHGFEVMQIQNCPNLREVASLRPLLERVANTRDDEATFYVHTKGNSTGDNVKGATRWAALMYDKLLQRDAADLLTRAHAVGTHKMVWPDGEHNQYPTRLQRGNWMFAGTFFWFRHDQVFTHPRWRDIPFDRYGAEAYLAGLLNHGDVKSVWQPAGFDRYPTSSPYDPNLYPIEYDEF